MRRPKKRSKTKKKTALASVDEYGKDTLEQMAKDAGYRPSPYHKSNPVAWGLTGPSPRSPDKTICEGSGTTCGRAVAKLLKSAIRRGMVSVYKRGRWPQNVWAVDKEGYVYEAQLSNRGLGEYHGYPMKDSDSYVVFLRTEWERRSQ